MGESTDALGRLGTAALPGAGALELLTPSGLSETDPVLLFQGLDRWLRMDLRRIERVASADDRHSQSAFLLDTVVERFTESPIRDAALRLAAERLLDRVRHLDRRGRTEEARAVLDLLERHPVGGPFDTALTVAIARATHLRERGCHPQALAALAPFASRAHLIRTPHLRAHLWLALGRAHLAVGDLDLARVWVRTGLRMLYARHPSADVRHELARLARRVLPPRMLLGRSSIPLGERVVILGHVLAFGMLDRRSRAARAAGLALRKSLMALLYARTRRGMDRRLPVPVTAARARGTHPLRMVRETSASRVLVTRAMGGIGDLLMMTPGLRALHRRHPGSPVRLAVPAAYAPLFEGNPHVETIDIDSDSLAPSRYSEWIDLTDCPAAFHESRTVPHVTRNRIELFAEAMGVSRRELRVAGLRPVYVLGDTEIELRRSYWKRHGLEDRRVIGVGFRSAESYRDLPAMVELIRELSALAAVIVFDDREPPELGPEIRTVSGRPLREAFALAAGCDLLVAPDSAFVHLAGALGRPALGLFGPTDGRLRTLAYPEVVWMDVRSDLACIPCWRNEVTPCAITGTGRSACLASIPTREVVARVRRMLPRPHRERS